MIAKRPKQRRVAQSTHRVPKTSLNQSMFEGHAELLEHGSPVPNEFFSATHATMTADEASGMKTCKSAS